MGREKIKEGNYLPEPVLSCFILKFFNPAKTRVLLEVPFYPYLLTTDKPYPNAVLPAELPTGLKFTGAGEKWPNFPCMSWLYPQRHL